MCDMKATQMNVQCSLIQELVLYKSELSHIVAKAIKNIVWKVKAQFITVQ